MTPPSFIQRWSRRKLEAAAALPDAATLPAPESLGFGSDFSVWMDPDVPAGERTAALRRLFMTDHYRAMDGLDVYVGDYSRPAELDAMLLGALAHAGAALTPGRVPDPSPAQDVAVSDLPPEPA